MKKQKHRELLLENLRAGMSIEAACAQSNVGKTTYYSWLKKSGPDGEWTREVNAAIYFSEAVLIQNLKNMASLKEDWRAYAWLLERRFNDRWGARQELDLNVNNANEVSNEMFAKMVEQSNEAYRNGLEDQSNESSN